MQTNRRNFLSILGSTISIPTLQVLAKDLQEKNKSKHIIYVWLGGGMSHSDNFNIAPDAIEGYKSIAGHIQTKHGYIGGYWQQLAKISNLYSLVHSFGHINPGHQGGTGYVMSGYNFTDENQGAQQTHPSVGSLIAKRFGTINNGIPSYILNGNVFGSYSSYLGNMYNPFTLDKKEDLILNIDSNRLLLRKSMLNQINKYQNTPSYVDAHKEQAFKMLLGDIKSAFDIQKESDQIKSLYGNSQVGQNCILARRLIERGTRVVVITDHGWDHHTNINDSLKNKVPQIDQALAGLLIDLNQRNMLKDTLVVVTSEFGRTKINKDAGRDHWSRITPLLLAGGNYGGSIIGTMDKNGFEQNSNPFGPIDLLHTILSFCDIEKGWTNTDLSGRPRYAVEGEAKIIV